MQRTQLATLYRCTFNNVNKYVEEIIRPYGFGHGQLDYLLEIDNSPGINQKELADTLKVSKAGVTKAVKILLDKGVIERVASCDDRRNYQLIVAPAGQEILIHLQQVKEQVTGKLFEGFSDKERSEFINMLTRVHENSCSIPSSQTLAEHS